MEKFKKFFVLICTTVLLGMLCSCDPDNDEPIIGSIARGSWISENGNLMIDGEEIEKTSEIVIIKEDTTINVKMEDDSSWSSYYNGDSDLYKGVFVKDCNITLSPFVMGVYEVTQKLYEKIFNFESAYFQGEEKQPDEGEKQENRPVENIRWYTACAFCNELTKKTMGKEHCVYYIDPCCRAPYSLNDGICNIYIKYDYNHKKWLADGYRLPTEAEWELAVRGGNPNEEYWRWAYSGAPSSQYVIDISIKNNNDYKNYKLIKDDNLATVAKYKTGITNLVRVDVGIRKPNKLHIYDMSGNVSEWCYDSMANTSFDDLFLIDGYIQNPVCDNNSITKVVRGGSFNDTPSEILVSKTEGAKRNGFSVYLGLRVVRTIDYSDVPQIEGNTRILKKPIKEFSKINAKTKNPSKKSK